MPKNTVNPIFDTGDYPSRIEIRKFVSKPDKKFPHGFYGIEKLV